MRKKLKISRMWPEPAGTVRNGFRTPPLKHLTPFHKKIMVRSSILKKISSTKRGWVISGQHGSVTMKKILDQREVHNYKRKLYIILVWTPLPMFFQYHIIQNCIKDGDFFLGGPNEGLFALWSISSHVGVQICRELVRLIKLIGSNKFLIHIISPRPLKKFSWATFRWSVLGKCRFLVI